MTVDRDPPLRPRLLTRGEARVTSLMQWRPTGAHVTRTENPIAFCLTGTCFSEVLLPLFAGMGEPDVTKSHPPTWKCHGQPNIERSRAGINPSRGVRHSRLHRARSRYRQAPARKVRSGLLEPLVSVGWVDLAITNVVESLPSLNEHQREWLLPSSMYCLKPATFASTACHNAFPRDTTTFLETQCVSRRRHSRTGRHLRVRSLEY